MKLIEATCAHCGAQLTIDIDKSMAFCQFCGAELIIDQQNSFINENNAESIGYQFEKGRQRAQRETVYQQAGNSTLPSPPVRKRHIFWWVMGWIFIFPIPVTILVARNKRIKSWMKALIIIVAWAVYFLIGALAKNN